VHQLKRVAVGGLSLGNLLPGQWRQLTATEVETLRRDALAAVGTDREPLRPTRPARGRPFVPRGQGRPGGPGPRSPAGAPGPRRPVAAPGPRKPGAGEGPRKPVVFKRKRAGKASSWRTQKPKSPGRGAE
jgi:23S rRNA pseudouridine2605 synthase